MLCAIIGNDDVGKSTIIAELNNKYGFKSFIRPSPMYREFTEAYSKNIDRNNIRQILDYHMLYQLDFYKNDDELRNTVDGENVLLDRYYPDSVAYFQVDFFKTCTNRGIFATDVYQYFGRIKKALYNYHELLVKPDLVIFLYKEGTELYPIESAFFDCMMDYKNIVTVPVIALKENTYDNVEHLLRNYKFI